MTARSLFSCLHGSHLYGTATAASDTDVKAVHLPSAREILLGAVRGVSHDGTTNQTGASNTADDVDVESFALQKYLHMVAQNQTNAIEMLFAPEWSWRAEPDPLWLHILDHRDRLLSRQTKAFAGYARGQAARYAVRGERVAAVRDTVAILKGLAPQVPVGSAADRLQRLSETAGTTPDGRPLVELIDHRVRDDGAVVRHVSVCGKMAPFTVTAKEALAVFERQLAQYGKRSLKAEETGAADWKAMMHALRIAGEAVELLTTGGLVFPRPDAEYLLAVRQGRVPLEEVSEGIETALARIAEAEAVSALPDRPDGRWIDELVVSAHGEVVAESRILEQKRVCETGGAARHMEVVHDEMPDPTVMP